MRIPLSGKKGSGLFAEIDDADQHVVSPYSWNLWQQGETRYAYGRLKRSPRNSKQVFMHRLIMGANVGGPKVDHVDGDGLNCQRENLRFASHAQNMQHRTRRNRNNSSGVHGVCWDKAKDMWLVRLMKDGKDHFLGYYADKTSAIAARKSAERAYFGEFAPVV